MRRTTVRRTAALVALSGLLLVIGAAAAGAARAVESCTQAGIAPLAVTREFCPGTLRVEKRAGSVEGELLPGATFSVECTGEGEPPPVEVTGLDDNGVATTGVFTVEGLTGMFCEITELSAPEGYELGDETEQFPQIPQPGVTDTLVFVNALAPVATVDPTDDPTVEPGDPDPTISPTVLGVKVVRTVPQLPQTGSRALLPSLLLGVGLVAVGSGLVLRGRSVGRHH